MSLGIPGSKVHTSVGWLFKSRTKHLTIIIIVVKIHNHDFQKNQGPGSGI
jgi:hypothetical protein